MKAKSKRCIRVRHYCLFFCVFWSLHASVYASEPDEITPQRKVSAILKDIKKTEAAVNKLFNQINSSNDYDLVCYGFEQTGSKMRHRICEPQFMKNARKADAQRFINGSRLGTDTAVPQSETALQGMLQDEVEGLSRELKLAVSENVEFAALIQQLQTLVREYAVHDKARSNDPAIGFLSRFLQRNIVD